MLKKLEKAFPYKSIGTLDYPVDDLDVPVKPPMAKTMLGIRRM